MGGDKKECRLRANKFVQRIFRICATSQNKKTTKAIHCINPITSVLIVFIISCTTLSGQVLQNGQVYLQNSGGNPLPGVQIMAAGAPPTNSDNAGCFRLNFTKVRAGEMLIIHNIYKQGYEIVNEEVLKHWILSSQRKLVIELCPEGSLIEAKMRYYDIGRNNHKAQYDKAIKELDSLKENQKIEEQKYEAELDRLATEYSNAMEYLDAYSMKLARINKDNLSEIEKRAMEFIEQGDITRAIDVFRDAKTLETFNILARKSKNINQQMDKMAFSLKQYADICMFAGSSKNFDKADEILKSIAESDTTNYNYCNDYAVFLVTIKLDFNNAHLWFQRSLYASENDKQRLEAEVSIFANNIYNSKQDNLDKYYSSLMAKLLSMDSDSLYLTEAALTLNMAYSRSLLLNRRYREAEIIMNSSVDIAKIIYNYNQSKYAIHYGVALCEYSALLNERRLFEQCIKISDQAIAILDKVSGKDKLKANFWKVGALNVKANALFKDDDYINSISACIETMKNAGKSYELHPAKYAGTIQDATLTLSQIYKRMGKDSLAIETLKKGVDIYEKSLSNTNPNGYAQALHYICKLSSNQNPIPMVYYNKAIKSNEILVKQGNLLYSPHNTVAMCYIYKLQQILPLAKLESLPTDKKSIPDSKLAAQLKSAEEVLTKYINTLYNYYEKTPDIKIDNIDFAVYYLSELYSQPTVSRVNKNKNISMINIVHESYRKNTNQGKGHNCQVHEILKKIHNRK